MEFEKYFALELKNDSEYFAQLHTLMNCVQANAGAGEKEQERACGKEFKELQVLAFREKTLYHFVNKRFFYKEISVHQG
eukprot:CAMPEP_0202962430 /NCGR_PEP_ID=MMETSP1396-20130829/6534_1 /ASSEMBLY_ACC=CAM_ASM_000872 /TAXON_ID= /ORGANISM="Pseudokeronopsis sp., Strain Brazil" /LENGTH=78 /DNA_ID=CAMNT_0049682999 /DNA_START=143 /DNA_END=379 /DNA_ORIENTATION=+